MQLQKDMPDHHDADLILKLYELRREDVMRASRHALSAQYWPMTADDAIAPTKPDHPLNAPLRQVAGYWEMVYGMARHGIVHADYLVENNGEGLFLYMRVEPFLDDLRRATSPTAFQHTEWAASQTGVGRAMMDGLRKRFAARLGTKARP